LQKEIPFEHFHILLVSRSRNFGAEVWVERVEILRILESWAGDHPTFEDTLEIFFSQTDAGFSAAGPSNHPLA